MTNLTPSEARRLIDKLHHNQTKEHGISILEEKYLAALEIALTVLEQQESTTDAYRQIENDVWIEWGGGRRPVDEEAFVEVKFKDGEYRLALEAWEFDWNHYGNNSDIIAYRVIENDGREG